MLQDGNGDFSMESNQFENCKVLQLHNWKAAFAVLFIISSVVIISLFSGGDLPGDLILSSSFKKESSITWTLYRKGYDTLDYFGSNPSPYLYYTFLEHYNAIVEPNAEMRLHIKDYSTKSKHYYSFTVCNGESNCKTGSLKNSGKKLTYKSVNMDCEPFDEMDVTITKYSSDDTAEHEYTGKAMCMYVRREIRDLTEDDLSALMDAMYTLWSTSDDDGQAIYGSDFHNITYLLEMHHFNAAWPESDHFHEGNGFLAQHIKMTNVFEKVIQLVDPSVTVPYWDFTIDSAESKLPHESPVYSDDMFGSMRAPLEEEFLSGYTYANNSINDFAIQDGRWAFIKSEFNPDKFSGLEAGYGYMRSPWNMNPSPYVTRFSGTTYLPKCSAHLEILDHTDMMDFMNQIEVGAHASVHGASGGTYGCDMFDPLLQMGAITDEDSKLDICKLWIFSLKSIYRKNILLPSSACTLPENVQEASCPFECDKGSQDDLKLLLVRNLIKKDTPVLNTAQEDAWVNFICGGDAARIFSGDHAESASPSDPSFWPIHPTIERLFQAKMMAGGFETSEWATNATTEAICTHSQCYQDMNGDGEVTLGTWDFCCYGHYESDKMLDFETGNKEMRWGGTNGKTIEGTDPTRLLYNMPYIYGKFEWDHCSEDFGGDIDLHLKSLYAASLVQRK